MAASMVKGLRNVVPKLSQCTAIRNASSVSASLAQSNQQRGLSTPRATPRAKYGGRQTVTVLPGDGVGPELISQVKEVFRYAGVPVDFEEVSLCSMADEEVVEHALLSIKRNGIAMKGNIESDFDRPGFKSRNVHLRTELGLYANVVMCKSITGVPTRHKDVDFVVIRENTEGEYSQLEHENVPGVVESLKIITHKNSTRIAKFAFEFARQHNRQKVTAVHKANIMKLGDGLFLECCRQVSKEYPDIEFESMIVDNCSMQLVSRPQQFDVMVLPNLYGNIIANIGTGLVGGPGVVSGCNIGDEYAVFEMGTRNTGRNIARKNIANPTCLLLAGADMLDHLGLNDQGTLIRNSVMKVLTEGHVHTPDIGGQATTAEVVQAIIHDIQDKMPSWY